MNYTTPARGTYEILDGSVNKGRIGAVRSLFNFELSIGVRGFSPRGPTFGPIKGSGLSNLGILVVSRTSVLGTGLIGCVDGGYGGLRVGIVVLNSSDRLPPIGRGADRTFLVTDGACCLGRIMQRKSGGPVDGLLGLLQRSVSGGGK